VDIVGVILGLVIFLAILLMEHRLSRIQASCGRLLAEFEQANRYLAAISANVAKGK
jgi:hypothetical protein